MAPFTIIQELAEKCKSIQDSLESLKLVIQDIAGSHAEEYLKFVMKEEASQDCEILSRICDKWAAGHDRPVIMKTKTMVFGMAGGVFLKIANHNRELQEDSDESATAGSPHVEPLQYYSSAIVTSEYFDQQFIRLINGQLHRAEQDALRAAKNPSELSLPLIHDNRILIILDQYWPQTRQCSDVEMVTYWRHINDAMAPRNATLNLNDVDRGSNIACVNLSTVLASGLDKRSLDFGIYGVECVFIFSNVNEKERLAVYARGQQQMEYCQNAWNTIRSLPGTQSLDYTRTQLPLILPEDHY